MDNHKMEIMCHLNEIGVMICKLKDGKKLDHCDKKVKDLHSYLKRKKRSKTMRKSSKSKLTSDISNVHKSFNVHKPLLEDPDKSMIKPLSVESPSVNSISYSDTGDNSSTNDYSSSETSSIYSNPSKPSISNTLLSNNVSYDTSRTKPLNI